MAEAFEATAHAEDERAKFWTTCVFACIALGILLPIFVLSVDTVFFTQVTGLAGTIIKALTGVPLYAAAAYCGRIAAQHRETARHMQILTSQIKSVRAYVSTLPKEQQHEIVAILGKRAFSDPELTTRDKGRVNMVPDQLIPVLEKAMDVAKEAVKKERVTSCSAIFTGRSRRQRRVNAPSYSSPADIAPLRRACRCAAPASTALSRIATNCRAAAG